MNQNDKSSSSAHRIKSLNQLTIPHNSHSKTKESPITYNSRRRNSQNTYNFSINKPLSPLSAHSSFLIPSGSGKYNGESSETFIKSKLSRESFKQDDIKITPPLRINTEKSYFQKEDGHSSSSRLNKRSNSLNSNNTSLKNETSGYSNYNNMKIPLNNDSNNNNGMDDNSSDIPILSQNVRRSPRSFDVINLSLSHNNSNSAINSNIGSNIKPRIPPSSQSLSSTPLLSHHHFLNQSARPAPAEKKSSLLLSGRYNTYYENTPSESPVKIQRYSPTSTHFAGWVLLFITYCVFVIGMYSVVFSRFMADTGNPVLDGIKNDKYYCYLIPLLIVIIYLFIFVNWFSMKFFRHN